MKIFRIMVLVLHVNRLVEARRASSDVCEFAGVAVRPARRCAGLPFGMTWKMRNVNRTTRKRTTQRPASYDGR